MWPVSKTHSHPPCTIWSSQPSHKSLAICTVDDGYSWSFAHCNSAKEVFARWELDGCDPSLPLQVTCVLKRQRNMKKQTIHSTLTRQLLVLVKVDKLRRHCGGFPSTCHSQAQDPLADQNKHVTHLGSLYLDQDKFYLAPEMRGFPSSTRPDEIDRLGLLDSQTGKSVQSNLQDFWHTWSTTLDVWTLTQSPDIRATD